MATTDYDFINTRNDIITAAYRKIGVLAEGETLTGDQVLEGAQELNTIISSWEGDGVKLFQLADYSFSTVASTQSYNAPTDPPMLGIFHASYDSSGYDVPIKIYPIGEFKDLYSKNSTGAPLVICFEPHNSKLLLYPTPDNIYTINLVVVSSIKDFDTSSGTSNIFRLWQRALIWHLALELSSNYGLTIGERQFIEKQANTWLKKAKKGGGTTEMADPIQVRGYF